jgi:hypothetical protein
VIREGSSSFRRRSSPGRLEPGRSTHPGRTASTLLPPASGPRPRSPSSSVFPGFQEGRTPHLTDGLTGTLRIGTYSRDFEIGAKGKSAKDPALKVRIVEKKSRWRARVKKADLRAAVGVRNETVAKPGVPLDIPWSLEISNGWMISGTTTFLCTSKEGKKGKGRLPK